VLTKTITNKDIIIRVRGGLGNQLFIYAFARYLSLNLNCSVLLETRTGFLKDSYRRKYKLNKFNIQLKTCSWYFSLYYPLRTRFAALAKIIYGDVKYMDEVEFYANSELALRKILESKKTFIDGYWQDSTFFADYEDILKRDLSLKVALKTKDQKMADDMNLCNSVAIHLRRVRYDNLLELRYYLYAINQIKAQILEPVFYVFSDDIKWCRQNFIDDGPFIFVDNKNDNDNEITEMWLMSQCKHFIIANSTYSWWGAWLSNNPGKIIIKPDKFEAKA
jgi:hypothetical protein